MTATVVPDVELASAAALLSQRVGLRLDPTIAGRLARCILDDATAHTLDVSAYVRRLGAEPALVQSLVDRVTVQESSFFRDPKQFAALRHSALPGLQGPVTVWSAGCANGQEAYSLAMTLAEAGLSDWRVIASDISNQALGRTRRGRYSSKELGGITAEQRSRHFTPVGADWQVAPVLQAPMEVLHHNLAIDAPPFQPGECDIVFCRNVLIYFGQQSLVEVLDRFARWLRPGAWLFLGYSESLWQVSDAFQLVRLDDAFVYRRTDSRVRKSPQAVTGMPVRSTRAGRRRRGPPAPRIAATPVGPARVKTSGIAARVGTARPTRPPPSIQVGMVELSATGSAALTAEDYPAAIAAFRKCAYLEPDQPMAHFHLAVALEAGGDSPSARRAYRAARRTLDASEPMAVEAALEGYQVADLMRLLDAKLEASS